ncbi:hypothetical protein AURDEDRAFT_114459 [Auricularia subglabra TFB-10046 SS5]|nr:hypothetical protein AURDEDRAFT_114459 [Auricularia subglabra TFB-10046 SS5]
MYAQTASECVAICTVQGRMVLDIQPRTHAGTLFTREVSLAAAPRFRLVNILDALTRARLHRSPCPAWSDWSWLHDAVWALAKRGYVQNENLSTELCMG